MDINENKQKMLLADDSVTIRKVIEMSFAEENIEVFTANNGESAMLKFVETQPDIVLAHVGLPGTNGYQICEMIKQDETTRHIPVLLLVGSFEPFNEAEAQRVNANGVLRKPFTSIRDVIAQVRDLLGHAPPSGPAPEDDDIEDLYKSSFARTGEMDEIERVDESFDGRQFEGQPFDDEMIETSSPAVANVEISTEQVTAPVTAEPSRGFDWSPAAIVSQPAVVDDHSVTAEPSGPYESIDANSATAAAPARLEPPPATHQTTEAAITEPSPEFIALVAQRVVEKLSDGAIREIAQEAVPRIAEKMMREALQQDKRE